MAYNRLEPVGEWRSDFRMANVMAHMANIWSSKKSDGKAYGYEEFMPEFGPGKPEKAVQAELLESNKTMIHALRDALGGKITSRRTEK